MIKSVKRLGAAVLSAVMMLTAVATPLGDNLPAVRESTSLTASAASWPSDYRNWSQAASDNSMMRSYGCWVVAQAKLLQEIGATPSGFNPDSYLNWEKSNGYINSNFNQVNGVNAPCKYAQQQGKSLSYLGAISSNITSKIWDNINNGYYSIIYVKTSAGSSHYVMIGNALSKSNNAIWVYNSNTAQSSAKPTSLSSKNYTLKELYTYKSGSTPSTDNVKLLGISSKKSNTVSDTNAFVVTDVYKPSNYKLTKAGIRIRREDGTYDNGWSEFHNTASTWTGYDYMYISYDMNSEVKITLRHGTKYYYKFYAVIEGKEYWSPEQSFTTTGSHSYGSWYTKTSATCTSGGTEERKCSCGATESRSTSALGHNYGSTYFEADHPHKYAHLCQRCGYKEFTGGNLAIYEKCDICYNENLPSKPCLNISSNGFKESDNVSFTWDPTDKTTHYNLTVEVLSGDEYKTVCRQTYVNSGFQATFGKGQYRAVLDSYNSNMFHQYTSDWRDWVHNSSDYVYFDIECAHEFLEEVVSPTYDNEGYTLHTCTKCGYSFQDDFVPALSHNKVTGLRAKVRYTNSLILAWDENEDAGGYEIEQYRDGDWQCIETIYDNTEVSYKVDDLRADTTYTFRIRPFVCIQDYNSYGEYTRLAAKTRIPNVTGLTSKSISSSTITLSWNKNNKATGYVIEQYKGGKWSGIATTKNNTTLSFTVKGLETDTTYTFRVKAYRTVNGKTEYSEYRRIQKTTAMDNVTGFKVKSTTSNSVTLTWNKTDRTTDYKIEQYKGGKWVDVDYISNEKSPVYTVTGLAPDTTYTFRIMALKITCMPEANNNSDYVRVAGKTRISNAAKFAGTALSNSAIKLVWSKNNMATGYVIEQYKGGKWTAIATTKNNTTLTFTVKGLAKGTTYSFRIKSFRKTGSTTEFSEYTAIKAATLLDGVSDFKVASTTGSWITLEWAKNDKATGYSIEQYKGGKWTVIATTKNNTTLKFTVKGLRNDTTYSFRIKAYKTVGDTTTYGSYVRIVGTTDMPNVAKFTGSAVSASEVKLSWSKNDKATGYVIEQYKGGKWTEIKAVDNDVTEITIEGLAKGTAYTFRIKSVKTVDGADKSSEYASVKVKTVE